MGNFTSTFYVPSGNGWTNGNYYCRFKVEQTYTSSANKSVFKVTPQFKMATGSNGEKLLGGTISADGTTLKNFSDARYRANFFSSGWTDIVALYSGDPTYWSYEKTHNANGTVSVTFACSSLEVQDIATFSGTTTGGLPGDARTYTLTITKDGHCSVTVKKGSTVLPGGATITYGDVLTITAAADSGYQLKTFTVNGVSKTGTVTHTVTGAVSVAATSEASGLVYIRRNNAWAAYECYIRKNGAWVRHRPYIYKNGAWVPYG